MKHKRNQGGGGGGGGWGEEGGGGGGGGGGEEGGGGGGGGGGLNTGFSHSLNASKKESNRAIRSHKRSLTMLRRNANFLKTIFKRRKKKTN